MSNDILTFQNIVVNVLIYTPTTVHILSFKGLQAQIHCTTGADTSQQIHTLQGKTIFFILCFKIK